MSAQVNAKNVALITQAVVDVLVQDQNIGMAGVEVERSEPLKETGLDAGWIGVYRAQVSYPERALGMSSGFRYQDVQLVIIAKQSDTTGGAACEDRLEALVVNTINALLTNDSLLSTVDQLTDLTVRYDNYAKTSEDVWTQAAIIFVTARGQVPVIYT